jgi:hypothetical protein
MAKAQSKRSLKNERIQAGTEQGAKKERKRNAEKKKKKGRMAEGRRRKVFSLSFI